MICLLLSVWLVCNFVFVFVVVSFFYNFSLCNVLLLSSQFSPILLYSCRLFSSVHVNHPTALALQENLRRIFFPVWETEI